MIRKRYLHRNERCPVIKISWTVQTDNSTFSAAVQNPNSYEGLISGFMQIFSLTRSSRAFELCCTWMSMDVQPNMTKMSNSCPSVYTNSQGINPGEHRVVHCNHKISICPQSESHANITQDRVVLFLSAKLSPLIIF